MTYLSDSPASDKGLQVYERPFFRTVLVATCLHYRQPRETLWAVSRCLRKLIPCDGFILWPAQEQ